MKLKILIASILVILGLVTYQKYSEYSILKSIDSYESCATAKGSTIQESYPSTCITRLGLKFTKTFQPPTKTYMGNKYHYQFTYIDAGQPENFSKREYSNYERVDIGSYGQCMSLYVGNPQLVQQEITEDIPFKYLSEISNLLVGNSKKYTFNLANNLPVEMSVQRLANTNISGKNWITLKPNNVSNADFVTDITIYYIFDQNLLYLLSTHSSSKCVDNNHILSTFKFTN